MNKGELRTKFRKLRRSISATRREKAQHALLLHLPALGSGLVMSYSALRGELDPLLLNRALAQEGRLVLPRVEEQGLAAYLIACPSKDLTLSPLGVLEPTPSLCRPVTPLDLTTVLVPGLSFDAKQHRLGYGKGYYDRFLASVPEVLAIGVGFTEQYADALPVEPHDLALKKLLLL